ncbi:hypothetical protein QM646_01315 [Rhodococcus erythropolis]|nr:hypothetical protein [Rhodococcus erythropolis]
MGRQKDIFVDLGDLIQLCATGELSLWAARTVTVSSKTLQGADA